jgi:Leu/Phe-tRNA-protein transferase
MAPSVSQRASTPESTSKRSHSSGGRTGSKGRKDRKDSKGSTDEDSKDDTNERSNEARNPVPQEQGAPPRAAAAVATPAPPDTLASYIPPYLSPWVHPYHGDFCYARQFHPQLLVQLLAEGFLPIATAEGRILLPKLHAQRCVIDLRGTDSDHQGNSHGNSASSHLHISKSVRKKSKRYHLTINQAWEDVVDGCRHQHGEHCWLYPSIVGAFAALHRQPHVAKIPADPSVSCPPLECPVRMLSVEVWQDNVLVAGELGYTVGRMYTSLTGFANVSGAGSVQLAATGRLLLTCGYRWWDLGMDMEYKRELGAMLLDRPDFVQQVRSCRTQRPTVDLTAFDLPRNCRALIDQNSMDTST